MMLPSITSSTFYPQDASLVMTNTPANPPQKLCAPYEAWLNSSGGNPKTMLRMGVNPLNRRRDVFITLAETLITADLGILPLALLHERLELSIVRLGNRLRLHLDDQLTTRLLDARPNVDNGLLQSCNAKALVEACVGKTAACQHNRTFRRAFGDASLTRRAGETQVCT